MDSEGILYRYRIVGRGEERRGEERRGWEGIYHRTSDGDCKFEGNDEKIFPKLRLAC